MIVAAQFAWYRAIAVLDPAAVARWTVLTPVLAVIYAWLLNGERASTAQLVGLGFVVAGILVSNLGRRTPRACSDSAESSVAAAS